VIAVSKPRSVCVAEVVTAYASWGTVAATAAALGISTKVARDALHAAGCSPPRNGLPGPLLPWPRVEPPNDAPRVTVTAARAQLLVAQTDAARDAVRRGDQAGADRALGAVGGSLRRIAASSIVVEG
jgi:hypothetical protein